MYPLKRVGWLCTFFVTNVKKLIIINNNSNNNKKPKYAGNHQCIAFHSKSLDMSHSCISYVNISSD